MIDRKRLLDDLKRLVRRLEDDLRDRVADGSELRAELVEEYAKARDARRTAKSFEQWLEGRLTQGAVAWILANVFVRFLEDNSLVEPVRLAGPGEQLQRARDEQQLFFDAQPSLTHREYLELAFRDVGALPATRALFDERTNTLWRLPISGDTAKELIEFWRKQDPKTGHIAHDFSDSSLDTRFLGDLYQDLSQTARKEYALLQTPEFIEEFILDRTLEPAIGEFGLPEVRLVDPACGSGHFLLGAFARLLEHWRLREPGSDVRSLVERALEAIYGVDLNPYAVAIARFRLTIAALRACGLRRLADAPGFRINLAAGDSLLHGARSGRLAGTDVPAVRAGLEHAYLSEDIEELRRILDQRYQVVVGNPPYITPKDAALNQAYRDRWASCSGKYSLAVPFMERLFDLALSSTGERAGYVGQITANSFMKREFGKKLIEEFVPQWDITHVIDLSGAYIPGHGTPTVIIVGRNRPPVASTVRTVMGIRGEPATPDDPARARVWTAIIEHVDVPGSETEFVSVADLPRDFFHRHPWSLEGGGASAVRDVLESRSRRLSQLTDVIGVELVTGEDEVFVADSSQHWLRRRIPESLLHPFAPGENIRDWVIVDDWFILYPYDKGGRWLGDRSYLEFAWPYRSTMRKSVYFGKTREERGLSWSEYAILVKDKVAARNRVAFSFVGTHNHFAYASDDVAFKQSAPVIVFRGDVKTDARAGILGVLNSSVACFWLKQVSHNKGSTVDQRGARQRTESFEDFYEFTGTKVARFPLPSELPAEISERLVDLGGQLRAAVSDQVIKGSQPARQFLENVRRQYEEIHGEMIALQEELDWRSYRLYGLIDEDLTLALDDRVPPISLGERAFEIALARKMAAGDVETTWFERHGSKPQTEVPDRLPEAYRRLVERRIELIQEDRFIGLIERPEYKRRWAGEGWEELERRALRTWLLDRLEDGRYWPQPALASSAQLADRALADDAFMSVATLFVGRTDFDLESLVRELVLSEAVPFLAALRYTDSGLRKRRTWEDVWELQRREDEIDARVELPAGDPRKLTEERASAHKDVEVGEIPVPPRYSSADFQKPSFWQLRGKLDVPKERFILYPYAERAADPTPVIGWAGWDHLQQATALASSIVELREDEGWEAEQLAPLMAGLLELVPWLHQWHGERDSGLGMSKAEYFVGFLDDQLRQLGMTRSDLVDWRPPTRGRRRGRVTA